MSDGRAGFGRGRPSSPQMALGELAKGVASMVRLGTVEEVDYATAKARVRIGSLVTNWLSWTTTKAGDDLEWNPPELGEQVVVVSPGGNMATGVIIGALYQTAMPANGDSIDVKRTDYKDGSYVRFNREDSTYAHHLADGGEFSFDVDNAALVMKNNQLLATVADNTLEITDEAITLTVGASVITLTGSEITISSNGSSVALNSSSIGMSAPQINEN